MQDLISLQTRRHKRKLLALSLWIFFLSLNAVVGTGCAHTRIAPRPVPPEAQRLLSLATNSTTLSISCPIDEIIGHQYLLIFLPFGRISIENVSQHLENALISEMSQAGVAVHFAEIGEPTDYTLSCKTLSLSAYDLLFFRRISSHISLTLSSRFSPGVEVPIRSEESENRAFAFHAQLERVLQKLFSSASKIVAMQVVSSRGR